MPTAQFDTQVRASSLFLTTSWHDVRLFGQDGPDAEAARDRFCASYWRPLYIYIRVFLRRKGAVEDEAEDLVQAFFVSLFEKPRFPEAQRGEGRFRSFLIRAVENFLKDHRKSAGRLKRRPQAGWVSLDDDDVRREFEGEFARCQCPAKALTRAWVLEILSRALARLREEFQATNKAELLAAIEPLLQGSDESLPYAELARPLGMEEGAFRTAVHRCRLDFRQLIRCEVARTLGWNGAGPRELEADLRQDPILRRALSEEMAHLLAALC